MKNTIHFLYHVWMLLIPFAEAYAQCDGSFTYQVDEDNPQRLTFQVRNQDVLPSATFSWDFGDGNKAKGPTIVHDFQAYGIASREFMVRMTILDENNACQATTSEIISVQEIPHADFTGVAGDDYLPFIHCGQLPDTVTIQPFSQTASTNSRYTIDWGDGSPVETYHPTDLPTNLSHVYNRIGVSTIVWTVKGKNGISAKKTQQYFVGAKPAIGIARPELPVSHCAPYEVSFSLVGVSNNTPGTRYYVSFNDDSPTVAYSHPPPTTIYHTFQSSSCGIAGAKENGFSAVVTAKNPCGTSTVTVDLLHINTPPIPVIEIKPPKTNCIGEIFTLCDATQYNFYTQGIGCSSPPKVSSWEITPAHGFTIVGGSFEEKCMRIRFDQAGTYQVKLLVQNRCGTIITTQKLRIADLPKANFATTYSVLPSSTLCAPYELDVRNLSHNASFFEWTVTPAYGWSFVKATDSHSKHPSILFQKPGLYQVNLTASNDCERDRMSQIVRVAGPPSVSLSDIPDACKSFTITPEAQIIAHDTLATEWRWQTPGGALVGKRIGTIAFEDSLNFIRLKVANVCGETIVLDTIRIRPLAELNIPDSLFICSDIGSVLLPDYFDFKIPTEGQYQWIGPGIQDPRTGRFHSQGQTGSFKLTVNYHNNEGCSVTNNTTVITESAPKANAGEDQTVCQSQGKITLLGQPAGGRWLAQDKNSPRIDPLTGDVSLTQAGEYRYSYIVSSSNSCMASDQIVLKIIASPETLSGIERHRYACASENELLISEALPERERWSGPGVYYSDKWMMNMTSLSPGDYQLSYTLENSAGCAVEDSQKVTILPEPTLDLSLPSLACVGESINFNDRSVSYDAAIHWDFGDGNTSENINPIHIYADTGTYSVVARIWNHMPGNPAKVLCLNEIKQEIMILAPPDIQSLAFDIDPNRPDNQVAINLLEDNEYTHLEYEFQSYGTDRKNSITVANVSLNNQCGVVKQSLLLNVKKCLSCKRKKKYDNRRKRSKQFFLMRWFIPKMKIKLFKPKVKLHKCPRL